jgi:PAS domain S-box-containing protein
VIINRFFIGKISLIIILILNATMASIVFRYYLRPYFEAANLAEDIAEGKTPGSLKRESEISRHLKKIHENLLDVTAFIETVGKSENQVNLKSLKPDEGLGKSLIEMQSKLNELSKEEKTRNWKNHGVAEIGDMLRKNQELSAKEISHKFLKEVIHYLSLNQGGVFIINEDDGEKYIELIACYAYSKKKHVEKRFDWGEGLVGQCILEKSPIFLTEIPGDHIQITSGLGTASPRCISIMPIIYNDIIYGAVEVASFQKLQKQELDYLISVCETFGAFVANAKVSDKTKILLEKSREIANELQMKEEILRGNTEELMATQEELNRRLKQIEQESKLTQSIVDAVNKTNASIELDMEGNIIDVNDMYLSLMEYSREDLIGKKEKDFVACDETEAQRYEMMWESIRTGAFNSGEFKRVSKSGKELWLSGTYSPITDVEGRPSKIIQLAQFTTEQKEKELEYSSKIQALNQSVYSLEFNGQGLINASNAIFQKEFGYKRSELINKPFTILLDEVSSKEIPDNFIEEIKEGRITNKVLKLITKDKREKHFICNFSTLKNLSGEINKILLVMLDFSEEYRLQQELKCILISEKRKKGILELNSVTHGVFSKHFVEMYAIIEQNYDYSELLFLMRNREVIPNILTNKTGVITMINGTACDLLGVQKIEAEGKALFDLLDFYDDEEGEVFKSKIRTPAIQQIRLRLKDSFNQLIRMNVWILPDSLDQQLYENLWIIILNVEVQD